MSDDPVKMARLAQRDERMSTGALYGDLADRIEELEAKLAKAVEAIETMQVSSDAMMLYVARTTLAELTGGKDE